MNGHVSLKIITNEKDLASGEVVWMYGYPFKVEVAFYDTSKQTKKPYPKDEEWEEGITN